MSFDTIQDYTSYYTTNLSHFIGVVDRANNIHINSDYRADNAFDDTPVKDMVVFRIETKCGVGMYMKCVPIEMHDPYQHPGPRRDDRLMQELDNKGLGYIGTDNHRYGFGSRTQMRRWVSNADWKRELADRELVVSKYIVPTSYVALGKTQVIFDKHNAKKVGEFDPMKI